MNRKRRSPSKKDLGDRINELESIETCRDFSSLSRRDIGEESKLQVFKSTRNLEQSSKAQITKNRTTTDGPSSYNSKLTIKKEAILENFRVTRSMRMSRYKESLITPSTTTRKTLVSIGKNTLHVGNSQGDSSHHKAQDIEWEKTDFKIRKSTKVKRNDRSIVRNLPTSTKEPVDYLELILDEEFYQTVVRLTNLSKTTMVPFDDNSSDSENEPVEYQNSKRSHEIAWKDITIQELRTFFGLFFWMGLVRYPAITDHWATNSVFSNSIFKSKMSRDRFKQILARLTFSESKNSEKQEIPFNKLSVLTSTVLENSKKYYKPAKNLSLDESMIAFNGRHQAKVYMPTKPIRFGFKAYMLSEASTGFLLEWCMHDRSKRTTVVQIIDRLLKDYSNCCVYMDSFYTTIESFRILKEKRILACGTVSKQRIPLQRMMQPDIDKMKGDSALCYSHDNDDNLKLFVWKTWKGKIFYLLSTIHDTYLQTARRYDHESKKYIEFPKPEAIMEYNSNMRGVDLFDQYMRYYSFDHGSKKWYKKIAYYFLEAAIINSFIIHNEIPSNKPLTLKDYKVSIIYSLLNIKPNKSPAISEVDEDSNACALDSHGMQLDCQICSNRSINTEKSRKRTGYYCKTCNIPVCAIECYDRHLLEKDDQ